MPPIGTTLLRLGTRGSLLARTQSQIVANAVEKAHAGVHVELVTIRTTGDRIADGPLHDVGGKGLFTKEIELGMETGQESAGELLEFLDDLDTPNVFVNFDPANMILYGAGDPIDAIRTLGRHVRHVHVKDATASNRPGEAWGEEVAFGTGQVGPQRFLAALHRIDYRGPLAIEREAGSQRMADVKAAVEALRKAAAS